MFLGKLSACRTSENVLWIDARKLGLLDRVIISAAVRTQMPSPGVQQWPFGRAPRWEWLHCHLLEVLVTEAVQAVQELGTPAAFVFVLT